MVHSQRKINAELTKMLKAYETLIKNPKANVKKWAYYGTYGGCRICALFHLNADFGPWGTALLCSDCPLGIEGVYSGCARQDNATCDLLQKAILAAVDHLNYMDHGRPAQWARRLDELLLDVQIMAVERMDFLIERLDKNGYQYK